MFGQRCVLELVRSSIGKSTWQPNFHAHIIWDWMDHDTGKSFKLNAEDMSAIQDLVAETLDMQRGLKKSETGIDHLERNDFIIQKQESKKKELQEATEKVIAEKEEAEAEVEAAKTEVADLWKEHDYLTSSNRTKVDRSNRLDFDIKTKQNRSQSLDDAIEAKSKEVSKLAAKADEKTDTFLRILYPICLILGSLREKKGRKKGGLNPKLPCPIGCFTATYKKVREKREVLA